MTRLLRRLPPPLIHMIGRLQFRVPLLRMLVTRMLPALTNQTGTIAHGVGRGLTFDSSDGYPGYLLGTSEPEEQAFLQSHLRVGGVFYDIGANIGFYSTIAGRLVGDTGSVWAFEPFPVSAAGARRNADLNGFDHVHVIEAAVGSSDGSATLSVLESTAVNRLSDTDGGVAVDVVSIDSWRVRTGAPLPTLVQIDVEGAELEVLRGMIETLRLSRPTILCEIHWIAAEQVSEFVAAELAPHGYVLTTLDGAPPPAQLGRWHAVLHATDSAP